MERRTIRGERSPTSFRHNSQVVKAFERLYCVCGCLMYEGPKPTFKRVSCPKCLRVTDMPGPADSTPKR